MSKPADLRIDYIEFPATDLPATKAFYQRVFQWRFTDYGPDYTSFEDGRISGGFTSQTQVVRGGVLVVLFADDLEACQAAVLAAGAEVTLPIFDFPGGRRFHFVDPSGNELAVWGHSSP